MQNLITLKPEGKVVFVGDTHGDAEASKIVIEKYLKPGYVIVFLGDYVDRGEFSQENVRFLLDAQKKHPKQIYLLLGNHETYNLCPFIPADFWESLGMEEQRKYAKIFEPFPIMLACGNIIACHGGLPDVKSIEEVEKIIVRDENWMRMIWGDFEDREGETFGMGRLRGRPMFGRDYFERVMKTLGKAVMVRGHQSDAKQDMFDRHCLTIFTSKYYPRQRVVAIADMKKEIKSSADLEIVEI